MSMRATRYDHFKPTPRSSLLGVAMLAIPILGYGWWMKTSRVSTALDELFILLFIYFLFLLISICPLRFLFFSLNCI